MAPICQKELVCSKADFKIMAIRSTDWLIIIQKESISSFSRTHVIIDLFEPEKFSWNLFKNEHIWYRVSPIFMANIGWQAPLVCWTLSILTIWNFMVLARNFCVICKFVCSLMVFYFSVFFEEEREKQTIAIFWRLTC